VSIDPRRWWGQRWQHVLDEAGPSAARRVQRGQALARRGAVEDVRIEPGRITGVVREDRVAPYRVELRWPVPDEAAWDEAIEVLAGELRFRAALLDGHLPEGIDEVLAAAGVPVLPGPADLDQRCTCPERARLCRHVAAVHTAAGALIDRDPFLLLALRGRGRDALLRALRTGRGADADGAIVAGVDLSRGLFEAHGDLDAVPLHPAPVEDPAALFHRLGDPPGVDDVGPLVRTIERAAAGAWRLAAGEGAAAADEELLLAELRGQRIGTAASLAEALGRDVEEVRTELDRLFEAGTVMRTGSGDRARYRTS
jgi:uncharacterized Zn finger protein